MGNRSSTVLFVLLLLSVAGTCALLLTVSPDPPLLEEAQQPLSIVEPTRTETRRPRPADIVLSWGTAPSLLWPGATGTITTLIATDGSQVTSGQEIAKVDGQPVIALHTPSPLYRDLTEGVRGTDVAEVSAELVRLGLLSAEDAGDRADWTFRQAVRELNRRFGHDSLDLRATFTMWLPDSAFDAVDTQIVVGKPAPARGEVFASGATPLTSARAVAPEGVQQPLTSGAEPSQVRLGDRASAVDENLRVVDLAWLQAENGSSTTRLTGAVLELAQPTVTWKIPASAVITGVDGSTCVAVADGSTIAVEVVGGGPGEAELAGDLPGSVVGNPIGSGVARGCE